MISQHPSSELIKKVCLESDKRVLAELLETRKLFVFGSVRLLLVDFLWKMREQYQRRIGSKNTIDEMTDCIYDLTLAKFMNFPPEKTAQKTEKDLNIPELKHKDVDCRNYYKAVLAQIERWRLDNPKAGILEEETVASRILQKIVVKHFFLSIVECRRNKMPFRRRYFWKMKGKTITLWYPSWLSGKSLREWLEQRFRYPNPDRPGETRMIQKEIDKHFGREIEVSLDDRCVAENKYVDYWLPGITSEKTNMLMLTVAQEKARNIDQMRPAIKALGKESLYAMILRIFDDIFGDKFEDNQIATEFGLSKATFSRFAGSKWFEKIDDKKMQIPDLWQNMAKIMAANPDFMELAMRAGIMPKLKKVIGIIGAKND